MTSWDENGLAQNVSGLSSAGYWPSRLDIKPSRQDPVL